MGIIKVTSVGELMGWFVRVYFIGGLLSGWFFAKKRRVSLVPSKIQAVLMILFGVVVYAFYEMFRMFFGMYIPCYSHQPWSWSCMGEVLPGIGWLMLWFYDALLWSRIFKRSLILLLFSMFLGLAFLLCLFIWGVFVPLERHLV